MMITVGICTFKRPQLLRKLLNELSKQYTEGKFSISVVVVDNDSDCSAQKVVSSIKDNSTFTIKYLVESQKSISRARNKVVQNTSGSYLAFIDDDEYPSEMWLHNLYNTLITHNADGVLGPVLPYFDAPPPEWLLKSGLCDRRRFATGTVLTNPLYTRTGNVLFTMNLFADTKTPFDDAFGITGGEDTHFFASAINNRKKFLWCDDAPVYELVPDIRQTKKYYCQRALLRGAINARKQPFASMSTAKSIVAAGTYSLSLPFLYFSAYPLFVKYLVKNCDHIGKLFGYLGIDLVKNRSFQS